LIKEAPLVKGFVLLGSARSIDYRADAKGEVNHVNKRRIIKKG
jgi:hypothetical protein